jgi:hypothetical protein
MRRWALIALGLVLKSHAGILQSMTKDLKRMTKEEKIEAYFEGYRRIPDDDEDFKAMEEASLKDLATDEQWPEAPADDDRSDR